MMRTLAAIVLSSVLAGGSWAVAQEPSPSPQLDEPAAATALLMGDGARGQAIYAERCSGCHAEAPAIAAPGADIAPDDVDRVWSFLARHYLPDVTDRADVLAHLAAIAGPGAAEAATVEAALENGDAVRGTAAYASGCVGCHAAIGRLVQRIPGETSGDRASWMWTFLASHHASDPARRADIIAYLLGQ